MHLPWEYKKKIFDACGYKPYGSQIAFHQSQAKHRILVGGNRAGKSEAAAMEFLCYLMWPNLRLWVTAANYDLCKPFIDKIVDKLVYKLDHRPGSRSTKLQLAEYYWSEKNHELTMWNGTILNSKSADNPDSLHAAQVDANAIEEAATFPWALYDTRLVPRLADSGGWIASVGTFEYLQGDWFTEMYERGLQYPNQDDIQSWRLPTTENPYIDQEWLEQERIRLCRTSEGERIFRARYLAEPVASAYLVFPGWSIMTHVDSVKAYTEYSPGLPVYLAIDPGGTYAVAAVQFKPVEGRGNNFGNITACLIDELYYTDTVESTSVIADCRERPWWGDVEGGAIDVNATEQNLIWIRNTGKTFMRRKVPIAAGNQTLAHWFATETFLSNPNCVMWQHELNRYAYPTPAVGKEGSVDMRRGNPKDAFNHLIKAVIYLLINKYGYYRRQRVKTRSRPSMWGADRRAYG